MSCYPIGAKYIKLLEQKYIPTDLTRQQLNEITHLGKILTITLVVLCDILDCVLFFMFRLVLYYLNGFVVNNLQSFKMFQLALQLQTASTFHTK